MKVLAIISSVRKQNTFHTIRQIEQIHLSVAPCEYEYLFLHEINLMPCTGCHLCLTEGENACPLKDDRDLIVQKIEAADAVILASPNHTMNVNWRMKNYIDRFSYTLHRPRYFNKRFMILITSGSCMGVKQALNALAPIASGGQITCKFGILAAPGMNIKKRDMQQKKITTEARFFAKRLQIPFSFKPSIGYLIWFSIFKASSDVNKKEFPANYDYYRNLTMFANKPLNIFQHFATQLFIRFFKHLIKKGVV